MGFLATQFATVKTQLDTSANAVGNGFATITQRMDTADTNLVPRHR